MFKKALSLSVIICFFLTSLGPLPKAHAQELLGLPEPGTMINLSPAYQPAMIKGVTVHKDNPFMFDFIVDVGQDHLAGQALKDEGQKLIKYFLASLAIPEKDLWVNLSPYEKDRIIPNTLGQTDMGRDLLAQDYILKQITASLIYPEKKLGRIFWDRVYAKSQQMYGTTNVPVNTFNKVWIMADRAEIFERNQTAFVTDSHLKVMLEEDYLALQKHSVIPANAGIHSLSSNIVRTIILPELEKEVNTGKNFANLRQITNSLILASWYKNNLKAALLNQVYSNKDKVKGIDLQDPTVKEQIYQRYLAAYKKGVFNYIKEDMSQGTAEPRKYFSGGYMAGAAAHPTMTSNPAMLANSLQDVSGLVDFSTIVSTLTNSQAKDASMTAGEENLVAVKRQDIKRIGLLTGGGPATGHNSLIAAAIREAKAQGADVEILGIPKGWAGLIDPDLKKEIGPLTEEGIARFENQGGTVIKSSRTNPLIVDDRELKAQLMSLGYPVDQIDLKNIHASIIEEARQFVEKRKVEALISTLKQLNIDGLIVMGGDDTNGVSSVIHAYAPDFPILGVPKTMDNDIYLPDSAPTYGYDSYITAAAENLRNLKVSAVSLERIFVAEVFGRDAGFTAIGSAARAGATLTLIPEHGKINVDQMVEQVRAFYLKHRYGLIVVSEGIKLNQIENAGGELDQFGHKKLKGAGEAVAAILSERLEDIKGLAVINAAKLDYATREAPISLADRMITQALGRDAVRLLRDGVTGKILYTDSDYKVKTMSFPNDDGIVTYQDNEGIERQMNISQLRGDGPKVSAEKKRKIGGRVAHVEEGDIDREIYVAANQAIFGERSIIMRIELELNRINKEMRFEIAQMQHLLNHREELRQLEFDIDEFKEESIQAESDIRGLDQGPAKNRLIQTASAIKAVLSVLIKMEAAAIISGQTDTAMVSAQLGVPSDLMQMGENLKRRIFMTVDGKPSLVLFESTDLAIVDHAWATAFQILKPIAEQVGLVRRTAIKRKEGGTKIWMLIVVPKKVGSVVNLELADQLWNSFRIVEAKAITASQNINSQTQGRDAAMIADLSKTAIGRFMLTEFENNDRGESRITKNPDGSYTYAIVSIDWKDGTLNGAVTHNPENGSWKIQYVHDTKNTVHFTHTVLMLSWDGKGFLEGQDSNGWRKTVFYKLPLRQDPFINLISGGNHYARIILSKEAVDNAEFLEEFNQNQFGFVRIKLTAPDEAMMTDDLDQIENTRLYSGSQAMIDAVIAGEISEDDMITSVTKSYGVSFDEGIGRVGDIKEWLDSHSSKPEDVEFRNIFSTASIEVTKDAAMTADEFIETLAREFGPRDFKITEVVYGFLRNYWSTNEVPRNWWKSAIGTNNSQLSPVVLDEIADRANELKQDAAMRVLGLNISLAPSGAFRKEHERIVIGLEINGAHGHEMGDLDFIQIMDFYNTQYRQFKRLNDHDRDYLLSLLAKVLSTDQVKELKSNPNTTAFEQELVQAVTRRPSVSLIPKNVEKDAAMRASEVEKARLSQQVDRKGGIDLNTSGMTTIVHKEGGGVEMTFDPATLAHIRREGIQSLTPVIFKITPIIDIWPVFGMQKPQAEERLAAL